jgi:hypothetical protein
MLQAGNNQLVIIIIQLAFEFQYLRDEMAHCDVLPRGIIEV